MQNKECCPKFHPAPWDGKIVEWKNKKFIKDKVCTFFYIPLNFGKVITRLMKKVEHTDAKLPDYLCLSDHVSKWKIEIFVAVDKEIPDAENTTISGKFMTRVYEGDFKETGKWCKDFEEKAKAEGHHIKKMYMWYTTCPGCAKKYGKNYVVIVGQL